MRYELINEINPSYNAVDQILTNRGIKYEDINSYLYTSDNDINSYEWFGLETLRKGAKAIFNAITNNQKILVVVDADCDGYTSAALLINYLYDIAPSWTVDNVKFFMHDGKQHGLSDLRGNLDDYSLIVCPDSSSEDYEYHSALAEKGYNILVLDHHEAKMVSPDAIVINNQLCDYPNKFLSGVGVVWQFCRFLDSIMNEKHSDNYLDLVALGLTADMMSLRDKETKHLVQLGFRQENLRNPFIVTIAEKNSYSLGGKITPMGAAFYIAPYVNAMVRSGTQDEKELLFSSMLKFAAVNRVPSTKRGHALGEMETLVTQAVRTCMNVKNRQTKSQDAMMDKLESMIAEQDLLSHKVLLFLMKPGEIDKNIAGLCANKIMAKYQRPCCILTRTERPVDENTSDLIKVLYEGSARGCDKTGVNEFKDICADTGVVEYVAGHQGAFGLGLPVAAIEQFISATDEALKDTPDEAIYKVDYIYNKNNIDPKHILDIAALEDLWGKDMDEPFLALEKIKVTKDMVAVYDKKGLTLKISLPNDISLMLFNAPQELCDTLRYENEGYIEFNIIGRANRNEWNGRVSPQIFIEEYEITSTSKFYL